MSRYSGKCDFCDTVEMYGADKLLDKYQVYASGNNLVPLKIESEKDLVVYYPYIVTMMGSDKKTGGYIHLSSIPYIDQEEQDRLQWKLDTLIRYYKRCKRKGLVFDKNNALEQITFFLDEPKEYEIELINRVAELGVHATTEDLHTPEHDRLRKDWYELMIEEGWYESWAYRWVYGWRRWADKFCPEPTIVQQELEL